MPELIAPAARLHDAWLEAHAGWGPGSHEDGSGLRPSGEAGTPWECLPVPSTRLLRLGR
jgi:hypothetical protein